MSDFLLKFLDEVYDVYKEVTSTDTLMDTIIKGPPKTYPTYKTTSSVEKIVKTTKALVEGDVGEAVCEAVGINDIIRTVSDIENTVRDLENVLYKVTTVDTVALDDTCVGALVFCELAKGIEHSGIYIGNRQIVEVDGDGNIRKVDFTTFYSDSVYRTGKNIFTMTDPNGKVLCSNKISERAKFKVGEKIKYNLLYENCHKFSAGCITGRFENFKVTFTQLLNLIRKTYGPFEIRKVEL